MNHLTLADLVDENELARLMAEYGPGQRRRVTMEVSAQSFDEWSEKLVRRANRRGEAVLAIQRPDGQLLLHTKRFYPEGIFRLPSGGVYPGESVPSGAIREAKEETGLDVTIERFLGMVEYEFQHELQRLPFVSYVFLMRAGDDRPAVQDPQEEITGFRCVTPAEIRTTAVQLRALSGAWADWGRFRALPHDLVAETLQV